MTTNYVIIFHMQIGVEKTEREGLNLQRKMNFHILERRGELMLPVSDLLPHIRTQYL